MSNDLTALGTIARWVESITPSTPDDDARAAVDELIPVGPELGAYVRRFCALIALSASIASFGLLADSGAVVIGAMLVAPLAAELEFYPVSKRVNSPRNEGPELIEPTRE